MQYVDRTRYYRISADLYAGLVNFLLTLPLSFKKTIAVEVGSYIGESANILSLFFHEVICVDPLQDSRAAFTENTGGRNITSITKTSDAAAAELYAAGYGLVYVDAVHTYEAVLADIRNYYPKVMNGGYIGGHDYGKGAETAGVVKAVNEAFGEPDFIFADESWLVKKTEGRLKA